MKQIHINRIGEVIVITSLVITLAWQSSMHGLPHVIEEIYPTNPPVSALSCGNNVLTGSLQTVGSWGEVA